VRVLVAIATVALLLVGVAAPHQHAGHASAHECVACTVGGSLEARDETPRVDPARLAVAPAAAEPHGVPVSGAPLGAVPGQSPPLA
jgi:hypothetical protein